MTIRISSLNLKYIKANGEDNQEISMIKIIMIREVTKIDICQIVQIGEHHIEVEVSMDKIIEEDHVMFIIIEMIIEEITPEMHRITEDQRVEVETEGIIGRILLEEVGVSLGRDNIQVILEGMIEVTVDQDQVELVLAEIEWDVMGVGNMIISLRTVQQYS